MIVLVVSNYRLLIEAVRKHGFITNELSKLNHDYLKASLSDKLFLFPFASGLAIVQIIIFQTYVIEMLLGRHFVRERFGMILHFVNTNLSLGVICALVWYLIDSPFVGAGLVMQVGVLDLAHSPNSILCTDTHNDTHNRKRSGDHNVAEAHQLCPCKSGLPAGEVLWDSARDSEGS